MKNKNLVLVALAIGCGLVAAFLTAKLGAGSKQEMIPVLVAAKNLDQGTKLDKPEELFVRKPFPRESVPPEFIDDVTQLKGKTLQRTVRPGTHVTLEDITPKNPIDLPVIKGVAYKAMGIKISQEKIAGGLVSPGSRVDVIATDRQGNGKTTATTILEKVLVVAVNDTTRDVEGGGNWKNASTVTLAVTQKEGMILALASARGDLSLLLRSRDDETTTNNRGSITSLEGSKDAGGNGNSGIGVEMSKVVVAKAAVPAGTKINDPADFFEVRDWPMEAPRNAFVNLDELKGKTVTKEIFAHNFVPKEAFEAVVVTRPAVGDPASAESIKTHTMLIQVGTQAPQYVHYDKDGRLLESNKPISAGVPATKDPSPEIKPEPKPEKSEKTERPDDKPTKGEQ